jgi:amino acid transporter
MDLINLCLLAVSSCALVYTLQLIHFNNIRLRRRTTEDQTSKRRAQILRIIPAVCVVISVVATVVASTRADSSDACFGDDTTINPDIAGIGVLLSLFAPCLVLVVVLVLGHFTAEHSGAKEFCMAQCASKSK